MTENTSSVAAQPPSELVAVAREWLTHEGFYRYSDRRKSSDEVHAMAAEYLRLFAENDRLWEAVGCAEAHFDAATDDEETVACQMFYSIVTSLRGLTADDVASSPRLKP